MISSTEQIRSFMLESSDSAGNGASIAADAIDEFASYFDKESFELQLLEMETALIGGTENKVEVVQALFRDMHSLKGSSAMLKFEPMTHLLHNLEDVLGVVSNNVLRIEAVKRTDIFDFFLQAFDLVEKLTRLFHNDPDFVLKNSREMFGFYIRIIVESRTIVENIDQYMEIAALDEDIF